MLSQFGRLEAFLSPTLPRHEAALLVGCSCQRPPPVLSDSDSRRPGPSKFA